MKKVKINENIYIGNSKTQFKNLTETVLFENNDGITSNGSLNDNISNYRKLGCYARVGDQGIYEEINPKNLKKVEFSSFWASSSVFVYKSSVYKFDGNQITRTEMYCYYIDGNSNFKAFKDSNAENGIKLYKVVGYK